MSKSLFERTRLTKIELEFTADPNMYIFFEKGTGGGITYIFNR